MKLTRYTSIYENTLNISFSKILSHWDIIKNKNLLTKVKKLDVQGIQGGLGAIWNYPEENPSKIVIAYLNNTPIGIVANSGGYQNIFVQPKYRKLGIASKLKDILYKRK